LEGWHFAFSKHWKLQRAHRHREQKKFFHGREYPECSRAEQEQKWRLSLVICQLSFVAVENSSRCSIEFSCGQQKIRPSGRIRPIPPRATNDK
jgi:hypothetical protein